MSKQIIVSGCTLALAVLLARAGLGAEPTAQPEARGTNVREVRHEFDVRFPDVDQAVFTITRTFEARDPAKPMRVDQEIDCEGSVVTSLSTRAGAKGKWQTARLQKADARGHPAAHAPAGHPWVWFGWLEGGRPRLRTATFRATAPLQIRYEVWAQGVPVSGLWLYHHCGEQNQREPPALTAIESPGRPYPDWHDPACIYIERRAPPPAEPVVRYGAYHLPSGDWSWRIEVLAPGTLAPPLPPDSAPVVFVLDGSRSAAAHGGLAAQLEVVKAYLVNTPRAEVELVLASRTAERVFGRMIPAASFAQTLPAALASRPLRNGSFLDRGAALAAGVLAGKPGRIVLVSDGELRSRFDRATVVDTIKRAAPGSVTHLVSVDVDDGDAIDHTPPVGLSALAAALGGAGYNVTVGRDHERGPPLHVRLRRLVKPEHIESMEVVDPARPASSQPPSPGELTTMAGSEGADDVEIGEARVWKGTDSKVPERLVLTGWIWSRPVKIPFTRDPVFERRLPRLLASTHNAELLGAPSPQDALAQGFLSPGLAFAVPGDGPPNKISPPPDEQVLGSLVESEPAPAASPPAKLAPHIAKALATCALREDEHGAVGLEVEAQTGEILDVVATGADARARRCLEDAVWDVALPASFNRDQEKPATYHFKLAPQSAGR